MMKAIFPRKKPEAFVEKKKETVKRICRGYERKRKEYFLLVIIIANQKGLVYFLKLKFYLEFK